MVYLKTNDGIMNNISHWLKQRQDKKNLIVY